LKKVVEKEKGGEEGRGGTVFVVFQREVWQTQMAVPVDGRPSGSIYPEYRERVAGATIQRALKRANLQCHPAS